MGSVLPAVDVVVVALRFFAKRHMNQAYRADDWFILVSLVRDPATASFRAALME